MEQVIGFLEILEKGFGFLRNIDNNFEQTPEDTFVPADLIRKLKLKEGLIIEGDAVPGDGRNSNLKLVHVEKINTKPCKSYAGNIPFGEQVSIDPNKKLIMTQSPKDIMGKALDLITPIGMGQRGLIIAPPKSGKTTILKHIANSIILNHPDAVVFVLLVDERPEEVTDFRRQMKNAFVLSSSTDQSSSKHLRMTTLTMNTATRCAESGYDAVVLVDSLTRISRTFNTRIDSYGKTLSGGLGANALKIPRQLFGSARNLEAGGSLTIVATILVETGSRMDDVIFHEFKGTGNMDLILSRKCAERRIWPAINIKNSGTRKDNLLLDEADMKEMTAFRRNSSKMDETDAMEAFIDFQGF